MAVLMNVLKALGKSLIGSFLTEKFIKEIVIYLLEKLAKLTSNSVDDELVAKVKEALFPSQEQK